MEICGYKTVELLGQGTFGRVYLVEDQAKARYAMKIPKVDDDPDQIDVVEYDLLKKANSPYLLNAYQFYTPFNCPEAKAANILMPLAKYTGTDIMKHITNFDQLLVVMRRLLLGLNCMNTLGYIHADIKPENIVFYELDHPALSDFGATIYVGAPNLIVGFDYEKTTYQYAPPESYNPNKNGMYRFSNKSDVWSLGATFYEWLFRRYLVTYHGDAGYEEVKQIATFESLKDALEKMEYPPIWCENLARMLEGMLELDITKRFDSYRAIKYLQVSDIDDHDSCTTNYFNSLPSPRTNFDDFEAVRLILLSFVSRLIKSNDNKLDAAFLYMFCEAFWKCYIVTPDDFDLWDALILGVYVYTQNIVGWKYTVNPEPDDIIYETDTINMCGYLALTYNVNGLIDSSYYYTLRNRANVDKMLKTILLGPDPVAIVSYFIEPAMRELEDYFTVETLDHYTIDINLIREVINPDDFESIRYYDIYWNIYSIYDRENIKIAHRLQGNQDPKNPFKDSVYMKNHHIKI